jgi:phage terminase large subunit-like protein
MRRILVASILLSPLFVTAAAVASQPVKDASASTQAPFISTGVIPAKIVHSTDIELPTSLSATVPNDAPFVLKLSVDEKGAAKNIAVVKSINPNMDARVIEAVRQFRWQPAMLNQQAIPVDLTLTVLLQH